MDKRNVVFYQINLRMFTLDGTLDAAAKLLPHVKKTGANTVYLCSIFKEDEGMDKTFWSERQTSLALGNPKNPYRISDYYEIDEEYGTKAQLKRFIEKAHRLGLQVMLDLVYFHCGPNAKLIREIPDGVVRDENGKIVLGKWRFPQLNYASRALRNYLIDHMLYFVREFGVDGYRCDVGDLVPLDFWQEAIGAVRQVKPDILMLNEGKIEAYTADGIFDFNYRRPYLIKADPADIPGYLAEYYYTDDVIHSGEKLMFCVENHDTVTDKGRAETKFGSYTADLLYVWIFSATGIPFLYGGQEIADDHAHCLFANRFYNRGYGTNWARAFSPQGKRRFALIRKLAALRQREDALLRGAFQPITVAPGVTAYERTHGGEKIAVYINFNGEKTEIPASGRILLSRNTTEHDGKWFLGKKGFALFKS